jgi:hypothetical protein
MRQTITSKSRILLTRARESWQNRRRALPEAAAAGAPA